MKQIPIWIFKPSSQFINRCEKNFIHILNSNEKIRYQKITHLKRKQEYLLGHIFLRLIACRYLKCGIKDFNLKFDNKGKPSLYYQNKKYFLSLTHSHKIFAGVVAPFEIGIDVEKISRFKKSKKWVEKLFLEEEKIQFDKLKSENHSLRVAQMWTLMEALFKAGSTQKMWHFKKRDFYFYFEKNKVSLKSAENKLMKEWKFYSKKLSGYQLSLVYKSKIRKFGNPQMFPTR